MRLQFFIQPIIVGLVVSRVTWFQDEGLDFLFLRIPKCAVIEVTVMSTEEDYFFVYSGVTSYGGELGNGFKPPLFIHIAKWFVLEYPVQWDFEVDILGVLFCLVQNDGQTEAFTIRSCKDK